MHFLVVALPERAGMEGSIEPICPASLEAGCVRSKRKRYGKFMTGSNPAGLKPMQSC